MCGSFTPAKLKARRPYCTGALLHCALGCFRNPGCHLLEDKLGLSDTETMEVLGHVDMRVSFGLVVLISFFAPRKPNMLEPPSFLVYKKSERVGNMGMDPESRPCMELPKNKHYIPFFHSFNLSALSYRASIVA